MLLDDILKDFNSKMTFKILAFLILSLPVFQYTSQMQNVLLSIYVPKFSCQHSFRDDKIVVSSDQCSLMINGSTIKCSSWNYSMLPVGRTMVSDFNLVCDYKNFGDIILISWYMTSMTGPIMGWFSDKFGRKKMVIINLCLETVSTISLTFTTNVATNIICRICMGISANGLYTSYVWLLEMVDNDFRGFVGSFFWLYGCIAYMVFPLTSYMTKDWRRTQLFSLIPSCLYVTILFLPESPRWSCVKNRKQEMMESLKKIAKINKIDFKLNSQDIYVEKSIEDYNIFLTFKERIFIFRIGISFLCIFSINLLYSAIAIKLDLLSKNIYISMFFLGLMELPGLFLSYVSLNYMARKFSFVLIGGFGSVLILISILFNLVNFWQSVVRIVLGCIAKVCITSCNQSVLVYVGELCPTTHRSLGFAVVQIANLLSFTAAIYINKLAHVFYFLPMLIYFVFMVFASIIMYVSLPETKDLPIPETVNDQKMLKVWKEENFLIYMDDKKMLINSNSLSSSETEYNTTDEESNLINRKKTDIQ